MNLILEFNGEEGWVRVQPGVVQDELNAYLGPKGFFLISGPAGGRRATLGGMMGNHSTGARSILYGKTIDHVLEMTVVLSDGRGSRFRSVGGRGD